MKHTKLERAAAAAKRYAGSMTPQVTRDMARIDFAHGWVAGYDARARDQARRNARTFKQGLRLQFNTEPRT